MDFDWDTIPVIDFHAHLRNQQAYHLNKAFTGGVHFVVAMANTDPCLDNPDAIRGYTSVNLPENCAGYAAVSAITIGREGKQLVDGYRPFGSRRFVPGRERR